MLQYNIIIFVLLQYKISKNDKIYNLNYLKYWFILRYYQMRKKKFTIDLNDSQFLRISNSRLTVKTKIKICKRILSRRQVV